MKIKHKQSNEHPIWQSPHHHLDKEDTRQSVHWIELFYDLIHVVLIFMLGNFLTANLSVFGFLVFAGLFISIWYSWADASVFNSLYVSTDLTHRFIMASKIVTVMFMAGAIPHVLTNGWVYFACAYAVNRFIIAFLYHRTSYLSAEDSALSSRISANFLILSILFLISAFLPAPYSYLLFALGIVSIQIQYMLPKVGILEFSRFVPRLGHMSERFALLLLIVIGEGFFKLVVTLSDKAIYQVNGQVLVNYAFGGFSLFVLCWIYFDFVGHGELKNTQKMNRIQYWLSHLFLMLGAIMIGVALSGEVKVGFWSPYPLEYGIIGCIGLALFLFCMLLIQQTIKTRLIHDYATKRGRIFGIFIAISMIPIIPHVPAIIGNFIWGLALTSQIIIPFLQLYRKNNQ